MLTPEGIAQICHEANRAYCKVIGDASQPSWDDAENWQKMSAINGVEFHLNEIMANREPDPSASHENWLKVKLADGWKYGEIKDPESKIHPCCVPYDELPKDQRVKDYLFISVIKAIYNANKDFYNSKKGN